jgi:uncharacterized protein (DUF427 family)
MMGARREVGLRTVEKDLYLSLSKILGNIDRDMIYDRSHDHLDSMVKAILNETVLAESDNTQVVEGNHYFPPESVKKEYFTESDTR